MNAQKFLEQFNLGASCDDSDYQDQIVNEHQIQNSLFGQMLSQFYGANIPPGQPMYESDLTTLIGTNSCLLYQVEIDADSSNTTDNNDITFSIVAINQGLISLLQKMQPFIAEDSSLLKPMVAAFKVDYVIPLFKGLISQFPGSTYYFYKGTCPSCMRNSIIFNVYMPIDSQQTLVYSGDLSGLVP